MVLAVLEQSANVESRLGSDLNDEQFLDYYFGPLYSLSSFPFSFIATSFVYHPVFSKLCHFHEKINVFLASSVDPPQINAGTVL